MCSHDTNVIKKQIIYLLRESNEEKKSEGYE